MRLGQLGPGSYANNLNQYVEDSDDRDGDYQRPRQIFLRIAYFTSRNRCHLEASEGVNQKQNRLRKCAGGRRCSECVSLHIEKEQAYYDKDEHWNQLADSEAIADERCLPDPENIYCRQHRNNERYDRSSPKRARSRGPKVTEIADKQIAVSSKGCKTREPHQPANLKSDG